MAEIKGIAGAKNNGGNKDNGQNRGTEIASVAYMKILLALSEGQIAGQFTGQDICLDGTPLLDADGHENFPGVTWEWRSGLVDQITFRVSRRSKTKSASARKSSLAPRG